MPAGSTNWPFMDILGVATSIPYSVYSTVFDECWRGVSGQQKVTVLQAIIPFHTLAVVIEVRGGQLHVDLFLCQSFLLEIRMCKSVFGPMWRLGSSQ